MSESAIRHPYQPYGMRQPRPAAGPTLVEWAHEHLLSMLVSMEIAPGERIGIDAVARRLGISQTPIREALSRLEAERLVHKLPNVGYRASGLMTHAEVSALYELRLVVEPYAARRAAETISDDGLQRLAEVERTARAPDRAAGYARFASSDATLHHLIARETGNRFITETIEGLHVHLHVFRLLYASDMPEEAAAEHGRLIEALLARDTDGAEAAMRDHLLRSRARLEGALEARNGNELYTNKA